MFGILYIYICENKIYKLPKPINNIFKAINEFSDKEVLYVNLLYEILNRKPYKLDRVYFDRIELGKSGQFDFTQKEIDSALINFINYNLITPEELCESSEPLTIPRAPCIPSSDEKSILIRYLNNKYPLLAKDCGRIIESHIQNMNSKHQEYIQLIKKANNIRKQS